MTPYGIVYKDTVPSLNEGAEIWYKKSGLISKKSFILTLFIISLSFVAVNLIIYYFREDKELYATPTFFLTIMEIISVAFLLRSSLRKNVKKAFIMSSSKSLKQAVLREYDIEFSTPYSKSNYFYDEIEQIIEGVNSLNIIIEKENFPICISKSGVVKGEIEKFILIVREKMQDRYIYENTVGGSAI